MDKTTIEVTRRELSLLEEAVSHLMPTKRGPRLTELIKLRNKLMEELAVAIEEDRADD